jgi:hypothetical protein
MTADSNDPRVELNKISKLLIEDLLNTSDAELLQPKMLIKMPFKL